MNIHAKLQEDLHQAMKDHDELHKRVVRLLKSTIELSEVTKGGELDAGEFVSVVQKEIKTRRDTIADAEKANRQDLASEAEQEIRVLEGYLPAQLSEAELTALAKQVIQETGATSVKQMGQVLKILLPRLAGAATNQDASRVVRQCLENPN